MSDAPVTNRQLYEELTKVRGERDEAISHVEEWTTDLVGRVVVEVKKEVRWLVVLSVGLNQLIGTIDASLITGAAGAALVVGYLGKLAAAWFAP